MSNIIDFKAKKTEKTELATHHIFTLDMYINSNDEYEVNMEIGEDFEDQDVLEALIACISKFAIDQNLIDEGKLNVITNGQDSSND